MWAFLFIFAIMELCGCLLTKSHPKIGIALIVSPVVLMFILASIIISFPRGF